RQEIETLTKLIANVVAGRSQIFSMVGEPRMGKSRLVYEFTHSHVPPDWLILEAPSVSYGKATPYFPLIELLRRYFGVLDGEEVESIRGKVVDNVLNLDGMLKHAIPPIIALLSALQDYKEDRLANHESNGQRHGIIETIK